MIEIKPTAPPKAKPTEFPTVAVGIVVAIAALVGIGGYAVYSGKLALPGVEPTIDASSQAALKVSLDRIEASLSKADFEQFQKECMALLMGDIAKAALSVAFSPKGKAKPPTGAEMFKPLHGMTARQVHDKAMATAKKFEEQRRKK